MPKFHVVKFIFFTLLLSSTVAGFAQAAEATIDGAEARYKTGDFFGALFEYEKAMQIDSVNLDVLLGFGKTLLAVNNPQKASIYLKKAKALDQKKSKESLGYLLAESFRLSGDYRNARKYYNYALSPYRSDRKGFWYQRILMSKKANDWATKSQESTEELKSLGNKVNSNFSEFGAQIYDGNIYFSSLIADSTGASNVVFDKNYYAKLYFKALDKSSKKQSIQFSNKDNINFRNKHISNPSFLGSSLFFTVCDTNFNCEIYRGKLNGNKLVSVKKLNKNINNTVSNNTQPHAVVEKSDTVLYFVSNRKQGFGGLDIWRSKKESFGFGQATNVGNEVNSLDDEVTPFFDVQSHQLFFSSNWHIGYGGYDIFKSEKQGINFKTPINLGKPYNSSYNDYYFFPFQQLAIISSNRPLGNVEGTNSCCNDLYEVKYERNVMVKEEKVRKLNLAETKVNEEELNKFLPLSLYFHNDSPKQNSSDTSTNSNFIDLAMAYVNLKPEYANKLIPTLSGDFKIEEEEKLTQFFKRKVEFGTEQLQGITPLLLEELEKGNEIELAVRGYASSLSSSEYNLKLTLRRIQSLINYLEIAENGTIRPFLDNGKLKIKKLPLGEYAVTKVQKEANKLAAVYSADAASERKIEIVALKSSGYNASINTTDQPKLEIEKTKHIAIYKKGSTVKRGFLLKNTGKETLKVYQVIVDEKLVQTNQLNFINKNDSDRLIVEVFTSYLDGNAVIEILLVTNDPTNNMRKLEIELILNE
ncbi:MAG: hypothetical protein ACI91R_001303 [Vicingaceae bacterium]|jgi:hypothetical protein